MSKDVKNQQADLIKLHSNVGRYGPIYSHYTQPTSNQYIAASIEEQDVIESAMKEAEESYKEMMEIHTILDEAYKDLIKFKNN